MRRWNNVADLLRAVEPAFSDPVARAAAAEAIRGARIDESLGWSGETGYLIHVRMQMSVTETKPPIPLGTPTLLGVGADPLDAAVAGYDNPPPEAGPSAGMRYTPERSFYVWAETYRQNRIRFARLTPAESARIREMVDVIFQDNSQQRNRTGVRRVRIMDAIRNEFAAQTRNAGAVARMDSALTAYKAAERTLRSGRSYLVDLRDWLGGVERALQLIERYQHILTLEGLKEQARGMVRPAMDDDIRRANTLEALITAITKDREWIRGMIAAGNLAELSRREREAHRAFAESLTLPRDERDRVLAMLGAAP